MDFGSFREEGDKRRRKFIAKRCYYFLVGDVVHQIKYDTDASEDDS